MLPESACPPAGSGPGTGELPLCQGSPESPGGGAGSIEGGVSGAGNPASGSKYFDCRIGMGGEVTFQLSPAAGAGFTFQGVPPVLAGASERGDISVEPMIMVLSPGGKVRVWMTKFRPGQRGDRE